MIYRRIVFCPITALQRVTRDHSAVYTILRADCYIASTCPPAIAIRSTRSSYSFVRRASTSRPRRAAAGPSVVPRERDPSDMPFGVVPDPTPVGRRCGL